MKCPIESAVVFDCAGDQLVGIAHIPQSNAGTVGVVIVVGGPQYRVGSHRQFTLMARAFADAGYPVLRFDYRGMGDSDGNARSFDQVDDDISAAIDTLLRVAPFVNRVVLWGLCDAASACMIYTNRVDARVHAMILANPWVRTIAGEAASFLKYYYFQRLLQKSFWQKVFGGAFDLRSSFSELIGVVNKVRQPVVAEDAGAAATDFIARMLRGVQAFDRPLLFLSSERDLTSKEFNDLCGKDSAWKRCLARKNVAVQVFESADHTFSSHRDLSFAIRKCVEWLNDLAKRN